MLVYATVKLHKIRKISALNYVVSPSFLLALLNIYIYIYLMLIYAAFGRGFGFDC